MVRSSSNFEDSQGTVKHLKHQRLLLWRGRSFRNDWRSAEFLLSEPLASWWVFSCLGGLYLLGLEGLIAWWVKHGDMNLTAEFYSHSYLVSSPRPGKPLPTRRCGKPGDAPLLPSNSQWAKSQLTGLEIHTKAGSSMVHGLTGSKCAKLWKEKLGRKRWRVHGLLQILQESGGFVQQKVQLTVSQRSRG